MDARREDRLERLFEEATALSGDARADFVRDACADDPELRNTLARLVAGADAAPAFVASVAEPAVERQVTKLLTDEARDEARGEACDEACDDPLVGTLVAHFRIVAPLGRGGMGRVYEARDETLGRVVALKLLPAHASADDSARRRFEREARAASAIDHPNVCAIHEFGRTAAGQPFIAMALCAGETLRDMLARGPLPVDTALDYASQVAEGLRHAHAAGVVHRDVKPANVIVAENGRVRIVDFGIARVSDDVTRDGGTIGTVAYMSPEQTRGVDVDARTDVWSLGAVLHEMLTGRKPFTRDCDEATLHAIRHDPPDVAPADASLVSWRVAAVVRRCLEKDPARRYPRVEALLADLRKARRGGTPRAAAARAWTRATSAAAVGLLVLMQGARPVPGAPAAPPHRVKPEAMALYLEAARSPGSEAALPLLERAIAVDSAFALAHAHAGIDYLLGRRDTARARRSITAAIALDSLLSDAHAAVGLLRSWLDHDWRGAEAAFRRAVELNPGDARARHEHAMLLMRLRRCDEAVAEEQLTVLRQPQVAYFQIGLGEILYYCRRYDDAVRELLRNLPLVRDSAQTYNLLGDTYFRLGRIAEARASYQRTGESVPGWVDAAEGDRRPIRAQITRAQARWARGAGAYFTAWDLARMHVSVGDRDAALAWLERVESTGKGPIVYVGVDPFFDPLRAEPRFRALLARVGLP